MLFEDPSKRYPCLARVLSVFAARPVRNQGVNRLAAVLSIVLLVLTAVAVYNAPEVLFFSLPLMVFSLMRALGPTLRRSNVNNRADHATRTARLMSMLLQKKRLHRDLDSSSMFLLEECARHWCRSKDALDSGIWVTPELPEHYGKIRKQALSSLESTMEDVLLLYQVWLPDRVSNRHPLDYLDELAEKHLGKNKKVSEYPPPAFGPVREIADKLAELGDETERLATQMVLDPMMAEQLTQSRPLDETLKELRAVRQAEDELRQNLRA